MEAVTVPFYRRRPFVILAAVLFLCACLSLSTLTQDDEPEEEPLAVATEAQEAAPTEAAATPLPTEPPAPSPTDAPPSATPEPTATEPPPATPTPAATLEPHAALEAALIDALGSSNRDVERLISLELVGDALFVEWAINDNMTEGLIVSGAQLDLSTIMQAVAESGAAIPYRELSVRGYFPLTDQLGNTEEVKVVEAWYDRSLLEEINFEGFDWHNVYAVAKTTRNHELFEPEP